MKHFSIVLLLLPTLVSAAQAAGVFAEVPKPSGVKVRAVFRAWESFLNPNLCFPDAVAYKIAPPTDGKWDAVILKAAKQTSSDVDKMTQLAALNTEAEVLAATSSLLSGMGMVDDPKFGNQLVRVFEKKEARLVFRGSTISAGRVQLEGRFIAIADLENNELVLLTDGDAFGASKCED